jgi:hypothetical protein
VTTPFGPNYNPYTGKNVSRAYAQRMQRNYARGITQQEARGHRPGEARRRREYQEEFNNLYGISRAEWNRWYRVYIREMNKRSWPNGPGHMNVLPDGSRQDPRIFPQDLAAVKTAYTSGYKDPQYPDITWQEWIEIRLAERLDAMIAYQDFGDRGPGRDEFMGRSAAWPAGGMWTGVFNVSTAPPIELWYYH